MVTTYYFFGIGHIDVLEIVVNKQVLNYFEQNHLLPKSRHGLRPMQSTFSAVAAMHETWLENRVKKVTHKL